MSRKEQLEYDLMKYQSQGYQILAQLEFIHKQFKVQSESLQNQLNEVNSKISATDKELKELGEDQDAQNSSGVGPSSEVGL